MISAAFWMFLFIIYYVVSLFERVAPVCAIDKKKELHQPINELSLMVLLTVDCIR